MAGSASAAMTTRSWTLIPFFKAMITIRRATENDVAPLADALAPFPGVVSARTISQDLD